MRYILYILGFTFWFIGSYFCSRFFIIIFEWLVGNSLILNIFLVFSLSIVVLLGFYKILLARLLFIENSNEKFNLISTMYSITGIVAISLGFFHSKITYEFVEEEYLNKVTIVTIGIFLAWILINGFVFFPKSIRKIKK